MLSIAKIQSPQEGISEGRKFGRQEGKLFNYSSLSEISRKQQTDMILSPHRPIAISPLSFGEKLQSDKNSVSNPISQNGEKALLVKGTFVAGLGLGARLLFELMDDGFVVDELGKKAAKINKKTNSNLSPMKKAISGLGIWAGLIMMFIGGFAMLYTIFNAPKIKYNSKVNAFTKSKDMDVYIKGNEAEKEILTQMNDKAKNADENEKAKLKEQYIQMQMAKNRVPDFVKLNNKKS